MCNLEEWASMDYLWPRLSDGGFVDTFFLSKQGVLSILWALL